MAFPTGPLGEQGRSLTPEISSKLLHPPRFPMFLPIRPTPALVAPPVPRLPYTPLRLTPLGEWTAITLVTSLPIGPGAYIFGSETTRSS